MSNYGIKLLKELIKFRTESFSYDKKLEEGKDCADFIKNELESLGFKTSLLSKLEDRPVVVGELDSNAKETCIIVTHYDVVPAGDGWSVEPFSPVVRYGKIFGRGASDDKGGIAAFLHAMKEIQDGKEEMEFNVRFICTGDEELGSHAGLRWIASSSHKNLLEGDVAYILDVSTSCISVGCSTSVTGMIEVNGKQGHAAYPFRCKNAAEHAILLASKLIDFGKREGEHVSSRFKATPNPVNKMIWNRFSVTVLKSGEKPNVIPGRATIKFNWRLIPEEDFDERKKELEKEFEGWKDELGVDASLAFNEPFLGYGVEEDNKYVKRLKDVVADLDASRALCGVEFGATDGSFLHHMAGLPAIGFGPMDEDCNFHGVDEFMRVETMTLVKQVLKRFLAKDFE